MDEPLQVSVGTDDLVLLKISGGLSKDRLEALIACAGRAERVIKNTYARTARKVKILFDLSAFDGSYDVKAVEALSALALDDTNFVEKTACFGGPGTTIFTEIAADLANRDNIKFFLNKEEALAWLNP